MRRPRVASDEASGPSDSYCLNGSVQTWAWYLLAALAGAALALLLGLVAHKITTGEGVAAGLVAGCVLATLGSGTATYMAANTAGGPSGPSPDSTFSEAPSTAPTTPPVVAAPSKVAEDPPDSATPDPTATPEATDAPTQQSREVYEVKLQPLCLQTSCSGSQQVGDLAFSYSDKAQANTSSFRKNLAFADGKSSCTSLKVRFAGDKWSQGWPQNQVKSRLKFVQESSDPIYGEVGPGKIATLEVKLDGGPLYINAEAFGDSGIHNSYVLMDVTGECRTPDGRL